MAASFYYCFYVERIRRDTGHMKRQMTELDKKRVQTVRLTMTIIICNFFLWAPFCVVNVLQAFAPRLLTKPSGAELITYIVILGNLNSCVNPWIYILFNRNQVKRALCISTAHSWPFCTTGPLRQMQSPKYALQTSVKRRAF
uniref:G-protein coupled receptors family 1 profile domain-containing protein n=1 Tax=Parascaris equorum TaxID=6256 RepID=A0A914RYU6_PAREQ